MYEKEYPGNVQEAVGQRWTERKSYQGKEMN